VPIGVNTDIVGETLTLKGMVASLDGQQLIKGEVSGPATQPEALGIELAHQLKNQGAGEILAKIFEEMRPEA
jgi:hydroxymethylbilane synthase